MEKSRSTAPGKTGSRPRSGGHAERLEADGQTHRRDCECARCEAGFTPTERDREVLIRRVAEKQGRAAAARARERKKERARLAQLDLAAYFRQGNAIANAEVLRLREWRARVLADRRLDELLRLRREGMPLGLALAEIDQRFPPGGPSAAENDNGAAGKQPTAPAIDRQAAARTGDLFSVSGPSRT
jgi:hypothetical protein